jgi:DNA-binding response OmpR family regulator
VPVLILSARSDLPTKLRGFDLGANDYLAKPFSFDELVARVRVHVRRGGDAGDVSRLSVGRVILDLTRRQAQVDDRVVDLSDREFRLLYHLASHAGEVVSRERLLSEVWGYSFDPGSNVVDVCVRRLRLKLGSPEAIETVRNGGYRITAA